MEAHCLQELIDSHAAALVLYATQWCRHPDDAVQDALIELYRQDPPPREPVAWLYTVVRRKAMNMARSDGRRRKHQQEAGQQRAAWFVHTDNDFDNSPDYESYLAELPRLDREIVVARIWGERSFAEIAALVEQPLSTVHRRYHGALSALESKLNQLEPSRLSDD